MGQMSSHPPTPSPSREVHPSRALFTGVCNLQCPYSKLEAAKLSSYATCCNRCLWNFILEETRPVQDPAPLSKLVYQPTWTVPMWKGSSTGLCGVFPWPMQVPGGSCFSRLTLTAGESEGVGGSKKIARSNFLCTRKKKTNRFFQTTQTQ